MAILKRPDQVEVEISDGVEYTIERSTKVKSFRVRAHCRYKNLYEVIVEFKDTSILYIDMDQVRPIFSLIRRHRFNGIPVKMGVKLYLVEPGDYFVTKNKYGKYILGEYNAI